MLQLCRRMTSILTIAFASWALSCVSACGQKGALFLPGDPSEIRPEPTEALEQLEQLEDEEDEEEKEESAPGGPDRL